MRKQRARAARGCLATPAVLHRPVFHYPLDPLPLRESFVALEVPTCAGRTMREHRQRSNGTD